MKLPGHVFRALSSKKERGEIEFFEGKASVTIDKTRLYEDVEIESIQGKKDIYLDNGSLFTLETKLSSEQEKLLCGRTSRGISWSEDFSFSKALILSLILISTLVVFRYALTSITPLAVSVFPRDWEAAIGKNTYQTLRQTTFAETALSSPRVTRLRDKAKEMASANGLESPEILFHRSDLIGANALAFPGGPIVVTDDLVSLLQSDDLVLAIIAHEIAHVEERHALHQIIEVIGVIVIASALFGANETLIEEASITGINLWASKKSRDFEKEADLIALNYLEKANLDKDSFRMAIRKLTDYSCSSTIFQSKQDCLEGTDSGWLSSHPAGAERLRYLSDQ